MLLAFHKPFGVVSQFSIKTAGQKTLAEFGFPKHVYPLGRLDADSEGLLLLSDETGWNERLLNPRNAHERTYHAQVEGLATAAAVQKLKVGIDLGDWKTRPCKARLLDPEPLYPPRDPPIRFRLTVPTSWVELKICEGKNRQVRRMTAAAGFPTLRLVRAAIGAFPLGDLAPGKWTPLSPEQKQLLLKRE